MATKMLAPNTTIWWVPLSVGWDPTAPDHTKLTDARNISCAIDNGYKLGPGAPETDKSKSICESANVENRVAYTYEGSLTFFREGDLADNASAYARAFAFFKDGTQNGLNLGYLVRRVGYKNTVAAAVGHEVESYLFVPDNPKDEVADKTTIKYSVTFKQQGSMELFVALV